jgi:hypothetical protein
MKNLQKAFLATLIILITAYPAYALMSGSAGAEERSAAGLRSLIESFEPIEAKAELARNMPLLIQLMSRFAAPDFTYTEITGRTLTLRQAIAAKRLEYARIRSIDHYDDSIQSINGTPLGATAIITARMSGDGLDNRNVLRHFSITATASELWVKLGDEWKARSEKVLTLTEIVDGKTYRYSAAQRPPTAH